MIVSKSVNSLARESEIEEEHLGTLFLGSVEVQKGTVATDKFEIKVKKKGKVP